MVSVDGQPVPLVPLGSFNPTDVTIDNSATVDIVLEGNNIPVGTTVTVTIVNETEGLKIITSGLLAGTLNLSQATATATIGAGFSRIYTNAKF